MSNNVLAILLVVVMILSVASTAAVYFIAGGDSVTNTAPAGGPTSGKMALTILPTPEEDASNKTIGGAS